MCDIQKELTNLSEKNLDISEYVYLGTLELISALHLNDHADGHLLSDTTENKRRLMNMYEEVGR